MEAASYWTSICRCDVDVLGFAGVGSTTEIHPVDSKLANHSGTAYYTLFATLRSHEGYTVTPLWLRTHALAM